jgi:hypothetical protein
MAKNNENEPLSVSCYLGALTTDGALVPALHLPKKSKIVSAKLLNGAAIAASNSNYASLKLKSGSNVIGSLDTRAANEGAVTANVAKPMTLDSTYQVQDALSDLTVLYNETGTMALTDAILVVSYFPL